MGIPVDLVRQRPDIRAAERLLAAQTARVGVATADLYPSFSLGGLFSFDIGTIGDATGFGWNILPGVRWALFDRDRILSRINVEESRTARALLTYEQRMLNALEDVENAMVSYGRDQEQRARLRDAVDASLRAVDLVRTRYLAGGSGRRGRTGSHPSVPRAWWWLGGRVTTGRRACRGGDSLSGSAPGKE